MALSMHDKNNNYGPSSAPLIPTHPTSTWSDEFGRSATSADPFCLMPGIWLADLFCQGKKMVNVQVSGGGDWR
jgi:hypothetical protein